MKRLVWLLGVTLLMASGCGNDDFPGVRQLIERRVPWLSERVELCEEESSGSESFTLRSEAGKLCIAATSANAAAVGGKLVPEPLLRAEHVAHGRQPGSGR